MTIPIACAQLACAPFDPASNLDKADHAIYEAARQGARVIVLPEFLATSCAYDRRLHAFAEPVGGATTCWIQRRSRQTGCWIAGGIIERTDDCVFSTALLAGPAGELFAYRKQYTAFFDALREKALQYRGRMRVYFHEAGLLEELRYRLLHPAALLIVLPNGLVKLINALPFICGDFRRDTLDEIWARFRTAWHDPRVAHFVEELAVDPGKTKVLHQWVHL